VPPKVLVVVESFYLSSDDSRSPHHGKNVKWVD
jgi:hypothetical protein